MQRLVVATPYRENSILAIARAAAVEDKLEKFYTTLYLAKLSSWAHRIPGHAGELLTRELQRRAFADIPDSRIASISPWLEMVHVLTRRLGKQRTVALTGSLMYQVKARFDRALARELSGLQCSTLVGMYASSSNSFEVVHDQGGKCVLNFVNSHPAEHNRYLTELAGLRAPHHELIPDHVVRKVSREIELADLLLVPSQFVARQMHDHGVPAEKVAVIPYGVDLQAFHPPAQRDPKQRALECLFVGQIAHRKGIRTLLESAWRCLNLPVRFRLIGPVVSPEVLRDLPDNVRYEGSTAPGGVAEAMRQADLFVLPTLEDSFALVVFEAMATALPVITTSHAGSSELIEHGEDGVIIPPGDSKALTDAIQLLIDQPDLRSRLGSAARHKVQSAHSWEAYGQRVLDTIAIANLNGKCMPAPDSFGSEQDAKMA